MTFGYDVAIPGDSRHSATTGERRLMLATLEDALRTLLGARHGSRHAKCQREDLDWLLSDDRDDPFTYARICDALNIDADWLRSRVLAVRAQAEPVEPRIVVQMPALSARLVAHGGGR